MLPFLLYATTGTITGWHIYFLLTLGAFGVPQNAWEVISLPLALCIVICAYISLYRPVLAARMALVASLGMWCFYGPAIVATSRAGHLRLLTRIQGAALPYSAVFLLVLTTAYSFVASGRKSESIGTRLFPGRTGRSGRIAAGVATAVPLIAFAVWFAMGLHNSQLPTSRILLPDGYVGWVRLEFGVAGAPPVPSEHGRYVFKIPVGGRLSTSSPERFGWSNDEYFYLSPSGLRPLPTRVGNGRMIWGKVNGERGDASARRQYEEFFVGTEEQFRENAGKGTGENPPDASRK